MDGQNFENENNVTVDTTASKLRSRNCTGDPGNRTACEQLSGLYRKCTASGSCNSSCTAAGEQRNQCTGYCQPGTGYPFSIVLGCCTGWIGALFGIGGIICAVFANKQGKTGLAKAGLICSIIGIVLGIIITILAAVFSVAFMSELANYY